jgi:carboxymethylenebutenolidase
MAMTDNPAVRAGQKVELAAKDDARFTAYAAQAAQSGGVGIVILPGGRGLLPTYANMADRFAKSGIHAVAIDHFGRWAGLGMRDEQFDFAANLLKTSPETTALDVAAAVAYLRSDDGGSASAIFTLGFSFGGAASLLQAAEGHGLAGVIGFYGWPTDPDKNFQQWPAPITKVGQFKAPVLAVFGGADTRIPLDQVAQFQDALVRVGVAHRLVICAGAGHGFFDRRAGEFSTSVDQAWTELMAFIATYVPPIIKVVPSRQGIIQARAGTATQFTGAVWMAELQAGQPAGGANVYRVLFEPAARTAWHRHPGGQVLLVISGQGRVGTKDGMQEIGPGDLVHTRPCERHWHGAAPDSLMVHLAVNPAMGETGWEERVIDDE